MKIKFLKLAKIEFDEAIVYYESESLGLGIRFKNEIRSSVNTILEFPELYPIIIDDIRKCVSHTFPYSVFYAVANHFKEPSTYNNRF